ANGLVIRMLVALAWCADRWTRLDHNASLISQNRPYRSRSLHHESIHDIVQRSPMRGRSYGPDLRSRAGRLLVRLAIPLALSPDSLYTVHALRYLDQA